jgi:hypothetical protein
MFDLKLSQSQQITFVMVNSAGAEVPGLGQNFTVSISKCGGAFNASVGAKAEIGSGWYSYVVSPGESDTPGPLSITVTGAGAAQQNLEYVVLDRAIVATDFTYTLTNSITLAPIESATVWVTIDISGNNVVWNGITDVFGVARDTTGALPRLDNGTYYFWAEKTGFTFSNPDTEIVG